ncbi:hypothetical protein AOLI_G00136880 [Acnodon oligacanthus]
MQDLVQFQLNTWVTQLTWQFLRTPQGTLRETDSRPPPLQQIRARVQRAREMKVEYINISQSSFSVFFLQLNKSVHERLQIYSNMEMSQKAFLIRTRRFLLASTVPSTARGQFRHVSLRETLFTEE